MSQKDEPPAGGSQEEEAGPYLRAPGLDPEAFEPFGLLQDALGFVPSLFRAQTLRPDVLEAEARAVRAILLTGDALPRVQKELIALAVSGANGNACLAAQGVEVLRTLGVPEKTCLEIACGTGSESLSEANRGLLDFARKLAMRPREVGGPDIETLRRLEFSDPQILEVVLVTALAQFLHVVQAGLGASPDFPTGHLSLNLFEPPARLTAEGDSFGPTPEAAAPADRELVRRARGGDVDAFEELVKQNERRVLRVLRSITGSLEDAEDGAQRAFLKAYERLASFQETASFSTWLTRIAINEGVERVRSRKPVESLEAFDPESEETFRPRHFQAWTDDPETAYARAELKNLIEKEMARLPDRYRIAVLLRDVEQMTTSEAAEALGLAIPTLKTHLLRGRMMLREALAPRLSLERVGNA
jgi:RNA polymerase sigma-70 factor (ECF subfamily)